VGSRWRRESFRGEGVGMGMMWESRWIPTAFPTAEDGAQAAGAERVTGSRGGCPRIHALYYYY
jgi:hypothetical protein